MSISTDPPSLSSHFLPRHNLIPSSHLQQILANAVPHLIALSIQIEDVVAGLDRINQKFVSQPWQSQDTRSRCQICNEANHLASSCFQRYNQSMNPTTSLSYQSSSPYSQQWFPGTGDLHHITPDLASFHQVEEYKGQEQVHVGNGHGIPIHHTGSVLQELLTGQSNGGLYILKFSSPSGSFTSSALYSVKASPTCWHLRLGHPHQQVL